MASVPVTTPAPQTAILSLEQRYALRKATLSNWNKLFLEEKKAVYQEIANAIFKDIREKVETVMENPGFRMFTVNFPLRVDCIMESYGSVSYVVKKHFKEGTLLHKFIVKPEQERQAKEIDSEKAGQVKSVIRYRERESSDLSFDHELVNQWLKDLAMDVKAALEIQLHQYKDLSGNKALEFVVEWADGDGGSSSFSKGHSSSGLYSRVWVVFDGADLKKQEKKKGFFGS